MKRQIIKIDEEKCDGCGSCVPTCHEGALQIIDDKAVLISDLMCDGLGACIGHCPQDALTIEEREAEPYDEIAVMKEMIQKGKNVVTAHMKHLKEHQEHSYLKQGVEYLLQNKERLDFNPVEVIREVHQHGKPRNTAHHAPVPEPAGMHVHAGGGCPGSREMSFMPGNQSGQAIPAVGTLEDQPSALRQWPVQLHLINPGAGYFQGSDLLVSADCVAYALGNFHSEHLQQKSLVIACPKLDSNMQAYEQKLTALIDQAVVNTITVMIMEVPCCGGLLQLVQAATSSASRKVPVKAVQVGIQGQILKEEWI
ncbi:MAG: 4Fe-4S ferredoxin [Bacteroides sp. SM1_62]|nr:MAG: 4Fe-4S ferredoxin [Bacteroides sp. SM1_62]